MTSRRCVTKRIDLDIEGAPDDICDWIARMEAGAPLRFEEQAEARRERRARGAHRKAIFRICAMGAVIGCVALGLASFGFKDAAEALAWVGGAAVIVGIATSDLYKGRRSETREARQPSAQRIAMIGSLYRRRCTKILFKSGASSSFVCLLPAQMRSITPFVFAC